MDRARRRCKDGGVQTETGGLILTGQQAGPQPTRGASLLTRAGFALLTIVAAAALLITALAADPTRAQGPGGPATLTVGDAVQRSCFERELGDAAGVAAITVPGVDLADAAYGAVEARLEGPAGSDWDLTVFDAGGEVVAAGASSGASEVASGYLLGGGELTVQACRIAGDGEQAEVSVSTQEVGAADAPKASLATVDAGSPAEQEQLQALGLDLTEHATADGIGVVLHGAADREALERAGLDYEVEVPNLDRQSTRERRADAEYAAETDRSSLPSGSDTYRRLFEYSQELKDLAADNPEIVRPITLPHETYEGRSVEGVEITTHPDNLRDGKPVFLQMGVHHAREWPSGEHALEWAYELVEGYRDGDPRVTGLLEKTRTIVIPIVNPDGFNASREAGQAQGSGNGEDGSFTTTFPLSPNEYRRKNCRFPVGEGGSCAQPAFGVASGGVDPNRNYGAFWGGPGASGSPQDEDHYGPGPFSEPESQNIRELVSSRQVTTLITNHTFSNLVLRPPGLASQPDPVDEPIFKALGDAMAAENGYLSQKGYELYDTSGTTEDWSYNATGGLGFTFEIYCNHVADVLDDRCSGNFHPTYPNVVAEYEGTSPDAQAIGGSGNREAYFLALENTANAERHSVIEGKAPPGAILRLEKTFDTPTSVANPASVEDHLETEMKVPASGNFDYHVNPSTRPLVAQSQGRQAAGPPSAAESFSGAFDPATNMPCAANQSTDPNCFDDHPFQIQNGPGVDNDSATVRIEWATPASDWDLYVYTDSDGDGTSLVPDGPDAGSEPDVEPNLVGSSATGATDAGDSESATIVRPETGDGRLQPGQYVARVENYAALEPYTGEITFEGPPEFIPAQTESWELTCVFADQSRLTREVEIGRGERQNLDLTACGTRGGGGGRDKCQSADATLVGSRQSDRIVGTKGRDVIVALGGKDRIAGRGGNDVICAKGGKDKVNGGAGNDEAKGGGGNDRVSGGSGRDFLRGGGGRDVVIGNAGKDRIQGGKAKDRCVGTGGDRVGGCERR